MKQFASYSRSLPWLLALLMSALLAACGGGQDPILGGANVAPVGPTVTNTIPAPGAIGVLINSNLSATFSEAMDPATIATPATAFTLMQGTAAAPGLAVPGTVTYTGSTATFNPTIDLAANTVYTATVSTGAKNLAGTALATSKVWSFTTVADTTRPSVTLTVPATSPGPTPNVPANTAIRATFNEDMAPATINGASFTLTDGTNPVPAATTPVTYASRIATFHPAAPLAVGVTYTATITTAATDLAGNALAGNQAALPTAPSSYVWTFTTVADETRPTVNLVNPALNDIGVCLQKSVTASFSEAMDPTSLTPASFTLQTSGLPLGTPLAGTVSMNATNKIATFTPTADLLGNTDYTATITTAAKDLAGNLLLANKVWNFRTGASCVAPATAPAPLIDLGMAARFGTFGGTAGMTNTGNQTVITGSGGMTADIGTIATGNSAVTGFHDSAPSDIYTEVPGVNVGNVTGKIYTCTNSTTGPTVAAVNLVSCEIANQALLDAREAYLALVAMPFDAQPAANLANLTLTPGVYKAPSGSFRIQGGDLTLDALGDSSAIFVFQMASTLTVGGSGAAFPQSIILAGGAQAKNVFWQVGSSAIINAAGGGTMVGTIISQAGAVFSTAGNVTPVILNGRAVSLIASVTMVNTVITVPAP